MPITLFNVLVYLNKIFVEKAESQANRTIPIDPNTANSNSRPTQNEGLQTEQKQGCLPSWAIVGD